MINLAEQLAMMTCVEQIDQKKMKSDDTYKDYVRNVKTITQQNDQNQDLKLKN